MSKRTRGLAFAFAAAVLALPVVASGQTNAKTWRIGVLMARTQAPLETDPVREFPRRLHELGYVEGRNLVIEWRSAGGDYRRLAGLANELVRERVDVILTADGTPSALAARKAAKEIPIVFVSVSDPVGVGLVESLARPGGNVTGLALVGNDTPAKQMEMLVSMVPRLSRVAVITNPDNPQSRSILKAIRGAGLATRTEILPVEAKSPAEIAEAFIVIRRGGAEALVVTPETLFMQERVQIARAALDNHLPSIGGVGEYAEAGGLLSYGQDRGKSFRHAADIVDRILKGTRPSELPVEMPTKLELVINRKTAKALGLTIPAELLVLADRVIE